MVMAMPSTKVVETFLDDLWDHERDVIHPSRKAQLQEMLRRKGASILWAVPGTRKLAPGGPVTAGIRAVILAVCAFILRTGWFCLAASSFSIGLWMVWHPLGLIMSGVAFLMIENKEVNRRN